MKAMGIRHKKTKTVNKPLAVKMGKTRTVRLIHSLVMWAPQRPQRPQPLQPLVVQGFIVQMMGADVAMKAGSVMLDTSQFGIQFVNVFVIVTKQNVICVCQQVTASFKHLFVRNMFGYGADHTMSCIGHAAWIMRAIFTVNRAIFIGPFV